MFNTELIGNFDEGHQESHWRGLRREWEGRVIIGESWYRKLKECCYREEPINKTVPGGKFIPGGIKKCACVLTQDKNYIDNKGEMTQGRGGYCWSNKLAQTKVGRTGCTSQVGAQGGREQYLDTYVIRKQGHVTVLTEGTYWGQIRGESV